MSDSENEFPLLEEKLFQATEDLKLSYIYSKGGKELTVVFLHGLGSSKYDFLDALEYEAMVAHNLVLVDLIGYGNSSRPEEFSYSMFDQAECVLKLLNRLELPEDIVLVAHSMGGPIAILLGQLLGDRLVGLVIAEGNIDENDCFFSNEVISKNTIEEWVDEGYNQCLADLMQNPDVIDYARNFKAASPISTYKSSEDLVKVSTSNKLLEKLVELSIPVLAIFGEKNKGKFSSETKLAEHFPILFIQDADHNMISQNPEKFYESISDFLSQF